MLTKKEKRAVKKAARDQMIKDVMFAILRSYSFDDPKKALNAETVIKTATKMVDGYEKACKPKQKIYGYKSTFSFTLDPEKLDKAAKSIRPVLKGIDWRKFVDERVNNHYFDAVICTTGPPAEPKKPFFMSAFDKALDRVEKIHKERMEKEAQEEEKRTGDKKNFMPLEIHCDNCFRVFYLHSIKHFKMCPFCGTKDFVSFNPTGYREKDRIMNEFMEKYRS